VLLATYKTVGEGLNLNAARHAILLDREWNPGREDQAIGRIDRMNSTDQATIHIPEVEGTVDKFMRTLIERKRFIIGGFNEAVSLQTAIVEAIQNGEM
jgi:SNF2 family DNA or RNA helicase